MRARQPQLPLLWLLSDARNDDRLEPALAALPRGSGFVYRHYHLGDAERRLRFDVLARGARRYGHLVILAAPPALAEAWGADGVYGAASDAASHGEMPFYAAAHDGDDIIAAGGGGAVAIFLSPVFPTRSHPGARTLGIHGFHVLAQQSPVPVIALGGMTAARARLLHWPRWGAIDGLVLPQDS